LQFGTISTVLLYKLPDIIMRSAIEEACSDSQTKVVYGDTTQAVKSFISDPVTEGKHLLIIFSLTMGSDEITNLATLRHDKQNVRLLGFYPHVDEEAEQRGISAKVDYVVPRSALMGKLKRLLVDSVR
jgi:hypothetical protein